MSWQLVRHQQYVTFGRETEHGSLGDVQHFLAMFYCEIRRKRDAFDSMDEFVNFAG